MENDSVSHQTATKGILYNKQLTLYIFFYAVTSK